MFRRSSGIRTALGIAFVLCLSTALFADTIRLKDGSLIKGTIVSFAEGRFVVEIGEGSRRRELSLDSAEIASIEFDPHSALANQSASTNRQTSSIVPVSTKNPPQIANETSAGTPQGPANTPAGNSSRSTAPVVKPSPEPVSPPSIADANEAKPISLSLKVLADSTANGWTNSGFVVKRGQRIRVSGTGSVSLGHGNTSTPSGLSDLDDNQKLLKAVPTGALIAVIGDDNNDFIYVGESREFTAARDGALYLGVNEGDLSDNKGSYDVKIEILTDK